MSGGVVHKSKNKLHPEVRDSPRGLFLLLLECGMFGSFEAIGPFTQKNVASSVVLGVVYDLYGRVQCR